MTSECGRELGRLTSQALLRAALAVVSLLACGCGEGSDVEPSSGGPETGTGGADQGTGGSTTGTGGGVLGDPNNPFFDSMRTPDCPEDPDGAGLLTIRGVVEDWAGSRSGSGQEETGGTFNNDVSGQLVVPVALDDPNQYFDHIDLHWVGPVAPGEIAPVTSGWLTLGATLPGGGVPWCIEAAEIGIPLLDNQAEQGLIKFEITSMRPGPGCAADPISVSLAGCWTPPTM